MRLFLEGVTYHWYADLHIKIVRYNSTVLDEITDNRWFLGGQIEDQEWSPLTNLNDSFEVLHILKVSTVMPSEPVLFNCCLLLVVKRSQHENKCVYKLWMF